MIALTLVRLAYLKINASASTKVVDQILYVCEKYDECNNDIVINTDIINKYCAIMLNYAQSKFHNVIRPIDKK